jgi:hypothetical protein
MTLLAYQRALSAMIASPGLCLAVRANADDALAPFALSERERRRLATVASQPGMSTSCTLYRVNRITPIATYLPLTSLLLGDRLIAEAELFWAEGRPSDLQFGPETERFARFLERRIDAGELVDPYLGEVLAFELAVNRVRVAGADEPLTETVTFRHDPLPLLDALADGHRPDTPPPKGRYELVVDALAGDIALRRRDG